MHFTQVIMRPVVSEKSTAMKDENGKVTFIVNPKANKIEIAKAVEALFSVKVEDVNVVRMRPIARRRQGRVVGKTVGYKKAYVTLASGDKIEFFEGV
ncbi:50S ribosomal protein L23 [Desulfovibrio litoralis]|uniref:Large ribosomal subunit protein uL23 n=1 Tax=Desulfovibrio litoralis DSM 11393 TaxID=1121455 RepID=A0A1M7SE57_9BACT|nr:50S ribosomal protein L23 [Desulfovibrio litoralis]SHN56770.1 large subunit ribosomal protein L23 [Desulfovibrio litoralis DSM 11393]